MANQIAVPIWNPLIRSICLVCRRPVLVIAQPAPLVNIVRHSDPECPEFCAALEAANLERGEPIPENEIPKP